MGIFEVRIVIEYQCSAEGVQFLYTKGSFLPAFRKLFKNRSTEKNFT